MADQKISLNELADRVGITNVNLSNLKTGKVKAIRFTTLNAICRIYWNMRKRQKNNILTKRKTVG